MRYLFVLRGLPGSGKSTFIKENKLEQHTISPDNIRLLLGGIEYDVNGKPCISQNNESETWEMVNTLLEKRLEKGILTILDATSIQIKTLNQYKKLCEKYNCRLYIVDFDTPYAECCKRNKKREMYKRVPEEVLTRMYNNLLIASKDKALEKFNIIKPKQLKSILHPQKKKWLEQNQIDLSNYEKIIVFGDIHGCYTVLDTVMKKYNYSDKNFYIFTGDMFDRGIENKQVLQFCLDNCEKNNFIFLEGNHDTHLKEYLRTGRIATPAFEETLKQFEELKNQIGKYTRKLRQFACIKHNAFNAIITHGGIPIMPCVEMPTYQIIKGVGKYQDGDNVDAAFNNKAQWSQYREGQFYSIHGHRNINNILRATPHTINLEGKVELGGKLCYVEISDQYDHFVYTEQNTVFDIELNKKHLMQTSEFRELDKSPLVNKKELKNGIVSYNFTRDAFNKAKWNDLTITARGLFVDTNTCKVFARSYPKFFAIDERRDTDMKSLEKKLVFPVSGYKKENGFLGIVSYDKYTNDLFIASKSTNEGPYKEYFEKILLNTIGDKKQYLMDICKNENKSFIFECIDIINDPHIIKYDKSKVVLLDVIENDLTNTFMNYMYIKSVAEQLGVECKKLDIKFNTFEEFSAFINTIEADKYPYKINDTEGWVFVDKNHYMLKYKTPFYRFWKRFRSIMNTYIKIDNITDQNLRNVAEYFNKNNLIDCKDMNVIEARDEYNQRKN